MKVDESLLKSVAYLADRGFHGRTIARITGFTKHQIYYRVRAVGKKLRDYRDGETVFARQVITVTPCVKLSVNAEKGKAYQVKPFLATEE